MFSNAIMPFKKRCGATPCYAVDIADTPFAGFTEARCKQNAGRCTLFEMATVQIVKDVQCADTHVNLHSIFASMSFSAQWNAMNPRVESKTAIIHQKKNCGFYSH